MSINDSDDIVTPNKTKSTYVLYLERENSNLRIRIAKFEYANQVKIKDISKVRHYINKAKRFISNLFSKPTPIKLNHYGRSHTFKSAAAYRESFLTKIGKSSLATYPMQYFRHNYWV